MFFIVQEILNDSIGAPLCTGTGYVARRSALESIGGWPLAYTGEDYMLSALLTGQGWEAAFVREPMQVGLAPESLKALLEQRVRWVKEKVSFLCRILLPELPVSMNLANKSRSSNLHSVHACD